VHLVVGDMERGTTPDERAADAETWTPLIALRSTGTRSPLFLLPALGGDIRCYDEVVQRLGDDQPAYAFRPRGNDQDLPPHGSTDEMVADYASAIRELQLAGPYHLAGWSTGGIFAFALANALERAGDKVALLALFDAPLPTILDEVDPDDDAHFLCVLVNFANCFSGKKSRVDYEELLALPANERFPKALAEARRQGTIPAETPEAYIRRLVHVGEANVRAIQGYEPRQVAGQVQLFVPATKGGLAQIADREFAEEGDRGWGVFVRGEIELHTVAGDHFSMMNGKGGAQIAGELAAVLAGAIAAN
jgi:thioesterase domain-containing protein